ncbi:MAG: lasso peptide biosynthesis B2 protein [Acidimicrobiales bacterium]
MSSNSSATAFARTPQPLLLVRLASVAATAPLLIRAGLPRLQQWLEPPRVTTLDPDLVGPTVRQYRKWVDSIIGRGQPVVRPGCLTRGVTLYYGLRRSGVDVALCFGMGTVDGVMVGHCWLDLDDRPLLESADPRTVFTEVVRMSRSGVTNGDGVMGGTDLWTPGTP